MKKPHEDWFYLAGEDLAFAKVGLKDGFFAHVCFLSQQASEKAMKGYLVFCGKNYPKTHDLVTLHRLMEVKWLEPHLSAIKKLSAFYVPIRYPDAMAGSLPEGLPDKEDAANALQWARDIVDIVESHLK